MKIIAKIFGKVLEYLNQEKTFESDTDGTYQSDTGGTSIPLLSEDGMYIQKGYYIITNLNNKYIRLTPLKDWLIK